MCPVRTIRRAEPFRRAGASGQHLLSSVQGPARAGGQGAKTSKTHTGAQRPHVHCLLAEPVVSSAGGQSRSGGVGLGRQLDLRDAQLLLWELARGWRAPPTLTVTWLSLPRLSPLVLPESSRKSKWIVCIQLLVKANLKCFHLNLRVLHNFCRDH